jgi:translocation-and-assembly-module (TAM) inner membrane subunit TamB-like protein
LICAGVEEASARLVRGFLEFFAGVIPGVGGHVSRSLASAMSVSMRFLVFSRGLVGSFRHPTKVSPAASASKTPPMTAAPIHGIGSASANFVGPLKTGKVTLTSEPKLPQQEIVQLLLFGSADGQQAQTPSGSSEDSAVGAAGGEAAQPLNHALGQLGLGAVTTNVDTTDSANPKPEVEIQIARALSIQLAIVLGQPLPGVNPDTVLLSLDWRFVKKWTLSSTLGDAGTTIFDLLWQKRY